METNFELLLKMTKDNKGLLFNVLNEIQSDCPKIIKEMKIGLEKSDFELIRRTAHSLLSSAQFIGNKKFINCLEKIEKSAILQENFIKLENLIIECELLYLKLVPWIHLEQKKYL